MEGVKPGLRDDFFKRGFSHTLTNIGTVYQDLKDFDKSLEYFLRSLRIEEDTGDRLASVDTLLSIGVIYAYTDRFSEALEYVRRGFDVAEEIGVSDLKRDCCETFSTVLERKGDFREALEYHKKYKAQIRDVDGGDWIVLWNENEAGIYTGFEWYEQTETLDASWSGKTVQFAFHIVATDAHY